MKKLLKVLIVFVAMFGFSSTVMAYEYACDMKADNYSCTAEKSTVQRVYSYESGGEICNYDSSKYCNSWKEGEEVAACYLEYNDTKKTNFKGYFFNIMPKFGYKHVVYESYRPEQTSLYYLKDSEINAYYHGPNDMYAIEDKIGIGRDATYAVVKFKSSWTNSFKDKICPKFASHYVYAYRTSSEVSHDDYFGGEIHFSNKYEGVTDYEGDKDKISKAALLCISKDSVIEDLIDSYLDDIKKNIAKIVMENNNSGNKSDLEAIKKAILEENSSDLKSKQNNICQEIYGKDCSKKTEEGENNSIYCEDYAKGLGGKVLNPEIYKESILDTMYYLAVDKCVGKDSVPGKYLDNATNYGYYKLGKKNLAQTTQNPDYAKNLQNYLKGAPEITNDQVSCVANYLNMAEEIAEEEKKSSSNLVTSTQGDMQAARTWLDKGFTGPGIDPKDLTCEEMLGKNLTKILKFALEVLSIAGAIIAIVNSMISLIPALIAKDAEALKKAQSKCITMAIVLVLILLLPTLLTFMGKIFGYDLTCFNWMK